jgi:hypothetical protein
MRGRTFAHLLGKGTQYPFLFALATKLAHPLIAVRMSDNDRRA